MSTNEQKRIEAISAFQKACIEFGEDKTEENGNAMYAAKGELLLATLQPTAPEQAMPEAAAQGWKLVPVEPTIEMLHAALKAEGVQLDTMRREWAAMLSASPAALVAAKPELSLRWCENCGEGVTNFCRGDGNTRCPSGFDKLVKAAKPEQQAQAEPTGCKHGVAGYCTRCDDDAALQSHREAIAKKDAALLACVDALKMAKTIIVFNQSPSGNVGAATIDAAITQANEVLGRKEGK